MKTSKRLQWLFNGLESRGIDFTTAAEYAEPGYKTDKPVIVFANWNELGKVEGSRETDFTKARKHERALESLVECAWSDEWSTCDDCQRAVRTSGDSYGWTSFYRWQGDCAIVCLDCLAKDVPAYLETLEDDSNTAAPDDSRFNPADHGYTLHDETYETGFHPGQDANPAKILKALHAMGKEKIIFRIAGKGQFDVTWEAYYKTTEETDKETV